MVVARLAVRAVAAEGECHRSRLHLCPDEISAPMLSAPLDFVALTKQAPQNKVSDRHGSEALCPARRARGSGQFHRYAHFRPHGLRLSVAYRPIAAANHPANSGAGRRPTASGYRARRCGSSRAEAVIGHRHPGCDLDSTQPLPDQTGSADVRADPAHPDLLTRAAAPNGRQTPSRADRASPNRDRGRCEFPATRARPRFHRLRTRTSEASRAAHHGWRSATPRHGRFGYPARKPSKQNSDHSLFGTAKAHSRGPPAARHDSIPPTPWGGKGG
jgi:hypothetical protein